MEIDIDQGGSLITAGAADPAVLERVVRIVRRGITADHGGHGIP